MIKVNVTKKDISRARKMKAKENEASCFWCPIALAIKRVQKKKVQIYNYDSMFINKKPYACDSKSQITVGNFISRFDWDMEVHPIKFDIYPKNK